MLSRSRSAAGVRRYSAIRGEHFSRERARIEGFRFAAGLAFNQCGPQCLNLGTALLLAPNEIANIFAVVGVMPSVNLCLDPDVLLVGQGDGFAHGCHGVSPQSTSKVCRTHTIGAV